MTASESESGYEPGSDSDSGSDPDFEFESESESEPGSGAGVDPQDVEGKRYLDAADDRLRGAYEEPMSLADYVEAAFETPAIAADASRYLLDAIESMGTRTVVERGVERERYRFFDDPDNDGEHAVLGNTAALNALVEDLRSVAADRGKREKILWIEGPTATGKSELKRCLINGLGAYSRTPEGRRYTLEWNVDGERDGPGLSYGVQRDGEEDWTASPVQVHPLAVFPADVRASLLADLETVAGEAASAVETDLDPFSREAYDRIAERYRRQGRSDLFSAVTDPSHLRVTNYVVEEGQGIGVLHAEDDGSPTERLVGTWLPGMLRALDSRGRKNPQAFSYDGVLSQGNGLLTVVEDASQHSDLLRKLLNVPDEKRVKVDKGIGMDLDTQLLVISNPDLEADLDRYADREDRDPLKALKRRLARHEFRYLTDAALETQLVRRELTDETTVWTGSEAALTERAREPVGVSVAGPDGSVREREIAPHALAATALYSVVTRLDPERLPRELDPVEAAVLLERGRLRRDGEQEQKQDRERLSVEDYDLDAVGGEGGIPVTYTRDVLADLLQETPDREHPELDVAAVVTPDDALDAMAAKLDAAPVFSEAEVDAYAERLSAVRERVRERQSEDVLDALLADAGVGEETVTEYVEHVYAWAADEDGSGFGSEPGADEDRPDPLLLKVFETEHLGRFDADDYGASGDPPAAAAEFRRESVITALNRYAWEHRDEGFEVGDVDPTAVPAVRSVLEAHDWADIRRLHPDFDPAQWADPPEGTETARLKKDTHERLTERGYSPASAELTTRAVMREVAQRWD
jgi:non-specific serine/threonine protein kinase